MTSTAVQSVEHWHALRAKTVGASEVASLFYAWALPSGRVEYHHMFAVPPAGATMLGCVGRHKTGYRLYYEKAGLLEPDPVEGERIEAGIHLEPALATWAQAKWPDWKLRKVRRYITHPAIPGMGQSRDYELIGPGYEPVEFKNVDFLIFRDLWTAERDDILAPPIDITLQVSHQMAGTAARQGWIVACVGGNNLKRGLIPRHDGTIAKIEEAVRAFWHAVANSQEPYDYADYDTVADLFACGDEGDVIDLTQDNYASELCGRFLDAQAAMKQAQAEFNRVKAELGAKIGAATKAKAAGYRIVWPAIHRPEKEIPAKVQPALDYRGGMQVKSTLPDLSPPIRPPGH